MSHKNKLAAGARDGYVKAAFIKHKTASVGPHKGQDHDVAFAALEPLHRVDGDPRVLKHLAQQHHLSPEWRHHSNGRGRHAMNIAIQTNERRDGFRLVYIP